jgi:hypothetical protein
MEKKAMTHDYFDVEKYIEQHISNLIEEMFYGNTLDMESEFNSTACDMNTFIKLNNEFKQQQKMKMYIIENHYLTIEKQYRFPKTKKKRILKKFAKKYFDIIPDPNFYIFDNKVICHPAYKQQIKNQLGEKYDFSW